MPTPNHDESPKPHDSHDHGGKGHDDLDDIIRKTLPAPAKPEPDKDRPKQEELHRSLRELQDLAIETARENGASEEEIKKVKG